MTAHAQGRISLNPLRHIDWFGTLIVPLAVLYFSSWRFLFGWAKPVPVNSISPAEAKSSRRRLKR